MTYSLFTQHAVKVMSVMFAVAFISACSSTTKSESSLGVKNTNISNQYIQLIDVACEQQAMEMDSFAQQSGQAAQYLASAKAMLRCVNDIELPKGHPDADKGLRLMALAVMNLVKGGDIDGGAYRTAKNPIYISQ